MLICMCPYGSQVNSVVRTFNKGVDPGDMLFLDRHNLLQNAIEAVNREKPATELLYNGDVPEAVRSLLPIVEKLYSMPALRPDAGSEGWMRYMKNNVEQATFEDLVRFPELLRVYVKHLKKKGTPEVGVYFAYILTHIFIYPYAF